MPDYDVFAEREQKGWTTGSIVEAYIKWFGPITDVSARLMVERVEQSQSNILDLCCGQGTLTAMLVERGANVSGLDFSSEMLAHASKAAPGAALKQGDAANLPYKDQSFDAVLNNFGMMHLPDQAKTLSEIRRVLKPSGRFMMATWAAPDISPAFGTVFGTLRANVDMSKSPPQPDLFAFANPDIASQLMFDAGLSMTNHEIITPAWELERPEELFEIFLNATVGAAMVIKSQSDETIANIQKVITEKVESNFRADDGYLVPVSIAIVTAE